MPREKTLEENYDDCISKGYLNETRKVDVAKIKSNIKLSDECSSFWQAGEWRVIPLKNY